MYKLGGRPGALWDQDDRTRLLLIAEHLSTSQPDRYVSHRLIAERAQRADEDATAAAWLQAHSLGG